MNRTWLVLSYGLLLAMGAGWLEAQQQAPARQPARKAKKVWTNEDFRERPAAKVAPAAGKAEAAAAKPAGESAPKGAEPLLGAKPTESLAELEKMEEETRRSLEQMEAERNNLMAEIQALQEQRNAASKPEDQSSLDSQLQERRGRLAGMAGQRAPLRIKLDEIEMKKAALLAPPEQPQAAPGQPPSPEKGKKEEPKPAPR